uniref:cell division protein FtsZ n=1 Tax=Rhodopseudomonas sp. TaxID=1078 RepID=UPI003B3B2A48
AFAMADQVLYSGVACITDLMVKEGLINLDFADVRAVMREMGKAMMGTGEASGEKRALTAAEAAIANPLIDDSSMKGARGLLISITGGKDLTLFEVDEAATRIREEVDQDANIIVGATYDESLDGIIRVSVVATGIEKDQLSRNAAAAGAAAQAAAPADSRLAELTAKLRADNQRIAEAAAARAAQVAAAPAAVAAAPAPRNPNVERAALAAIAAAVSTEQMPAPQVAQAPVAPASYGDVTVRPIPQKPSLFPDLEQTRAVSEEPETPDSFIPQQPDRAALRSPRMPRFDELPVPAQNEIRQAARGETDDEPQKTRLSLLQRLANGLSRRDDESETAPPVRVAAAPAVPQMPPLPERRPQRSVAEQMGHDPVSEYAKRPAPQGLDLHGRPAPVSQAPQGDDHLDIPAFLRRQAN